MKVTKLPTTIINLVQPAVVGNTNLSNTNGWWGMVNVTLSVPTMLWFDMQPANQPQRYYRVVPEPITIP